MSDFYSDMAKMVKDLLAPTSSGGLGQGKITLRKYTPTGLIDEARPWLGKANGYEDFVVDQIGSSNTEYAQGDTTLVSDYSFMVTPPSKLPEVGWEVRHGGKTLGRIVNVVNFPPVGPTVYTKIWANR